MAKKLKWTYQIGSRSRATPVDPLTIQGPTIDYRQRASYLDTIPAARGLAAGRVMGEEGSGVVGGLERELDITGISTSPRVTCKLLIRRSGNKYYWTLLLFCPIHANLDSLVEEPVTKCLTPPPANT